MPVPPLYASALVIILIFSASVPAQPIVSVLQNSTNPNGYMGADDNSIYEDLPDYTNGGQSSIFVGATGVSIRRGLFRFDLSEIPPDSVVTHAMLELELEQTGPSAIRLQDGGEVHHLHRLLRHWGEGTADARTPDEGGTPNSGGMGAPAREGDATWSQAQFMLDDWTTPGGDFITSPSVSIPVGVVEFNPTANIYTFQSEGLSADVQIMVDQPQENHGWILIGEETGFKNARRFFSSETNDGLRPRLTVTYEVRNTVPTRRWSIYD